MTDHRASDRDVDRVIRSWLHEDRREDASRIAGAVLDRVDAIPQRRATWWPAWRTPIMNKIVATGLGAAAVVVALVVGAQLFGAPTGGVGGPGTEPTSTPQATPPPTPQPSASEEAQPTAGPIPEGPFVLVYEELLGVRSTVTIPAPDWHGIETSTVLEKGGAFGPPQGAALSVWGTDMYIYGDPCAWESSQPDEPATSLDALVAALAAQASRDASPPVDVTVGGYPGKKLTLRVPEDVDVTTCDGGEFRTLLEQGTGDAHARQRPGQIDEVWVVDVDGTLLVFDAGYFRDTPTEHVEEMRSIVESATFD